MDENNLIVPNEQPNGAALPPPPSTAMAQQQPVDTQQPASPSTPPTQAPASVEPVAQPSPSGPAPVQVQPKPKKKPLALIVALVVMLLLGGSAAAYFGYIVPNQPENIWSKALSNTAAGYDGLSEFAHEQVGAKGIDLTGTIAVSTPEASGDGNITLKTYEKQGQGSLDVGFLGSRYEVEFLGITKENAKTPDLYIKASGLSGLAELSGSTEEYGPIVDAVENQWIVVDHSLLDTALSSIEQESADSSIPNLSSEDLKQITEKISDANRKYLFASDENGVFEVAEEVGKEDFEGRNSFKFKVKANQENFAKYLEDLKAGLADTKVKELAGDNYDESFDDAIKDVREAEATDETVEVWVDMQTKTIRNIRSTTDDGETIDISMLYEGGSVYPFELSTTDGSLAMNIGLSLDTDQDTAVISFNYEDKDEAMKVESKFTVKSQNEPLNVEAPSDAKSVNELMGFLLGGGSSSTGLYDSTDVDDGSSSLLSDSLLNSFQL